MGLELPAASKPAANYVSSVRCSEFVFLAGHLPFDEQGTLIVGRLGDDMNVEEGYEASRRCMLYLLSSLKEEIGDLDRVNKIAKVQGMVNCTSEFKKQPAVINGASDLLIEIFGEKGRHTRTAIGVNSLPKGAPVEIDMIVQIA